MANTKSSKMYKDDDMNIISVDLAKIKARPTMYISSIGSAGILHLCKEIIDNNTDEAGKKESPCDTIHVVITDKYIMTRDNGRGIPTSILRKVLETIQAGSNMTRAGGASKGENGVGTTCTVALSSLYEVTTLRPQEGKKLYLKYVNANLVEEKLEDYNGTDHGLFVKFSPSKKLMGVDKIPVDDLVEWIKNYEYTLSPAVNFLYKVNGKEYKIHHKFIREFFKDGANIPDDKRMTDVTTGTFKGKLDETFDDSLFHRKFEIEFAIMYATPEYRGDDIRQSWMNMIHTPQNGEHMDGFIKGYMRFITEEVIKHNKKFADEDIRKDILAHLQIVIRGTCDFAHMFSAQTKHEVLTVNKVLGKAIEEAAYQWFKGSNISYASIVEAIIGNHRARIIGEQNRNVAKAVRVKKQWSHPDKYIPCVSVKTPMPKELFLVEGDSAGGGLNGARYPNQAILKSRGKNLNAYEKDIMTILNSDSWKHLIPILGCGIGDSFDIKNLKFDKIIIGTDADIDGFHIRVGYIVFFVRFLPEIIRQGKLFIAEPPLYQLTSGKDITYVATQKEYIDKCIKSIGDMKIKFITNPNVKTNVETFVEEAFNYCDILRECSITRSINRYLLEHIAWGLSKYDSPTSFIKNINKWLTSIAPIYKEIGFNHKTNQITATIDFVDQYVLIDDELVAALSDIIRIQNKYGLIVQYDSNRKNIHAKTELSHFFETIEDMFPRITGRYKGLGSTDANVLREVVMDPRTRRLIQVTMDDALTYEKLAMLVGKSKDNVLQRKEMLMNFKFTAADIDS